MELVIKGKNTEVAPAVRDYTQRKLGKLNRYLRSISDVKVEFAHENTRSANTREVVQVTVVSNTTMLRAEEHAADVYSAVDQVAATMQRLLERYKGRLYERGRPVAPKEELAEEIEAAAEEVTPRVVRVKRFNLRPMTSEEAAEQMEMLGHSFFLFLNTTNDQIGVVYRRRDGDYGLIEPVIK